MLSRFLQSFESGEFEVVLSDLVLENRRGDRFSGNGVLRWSSTDGMQLEAFTNGADNYRAFFGMPCALGKLIPDDWYLRLHARDQNGSDVECERISLNGCNCTTESPVVHWKIPESEFGTRLSQIEEIRDANDPRTEFLLAPLTIPSWTRPSNTIYENPAFGKKSLSLDWLEVETRVGRVSVQKRTSGLVRVRIQHADDDYDAAIEAVQFVLGFLAGRVVRLVAVETLTRGKAIRRIGTKGRPSASNIFGPPLGTGLELRDQIEPFVKQAIDYFSLMVAAVVRDSIHACMESVDSTFTTRALVLCTTVERLVIQLNGRPKEKVLKPGDQKALISCARQHGMNERILERLQGLLGMMNQLRPVDVLAAWCREGRFGITADDIDAWKSLRNPASHGTLLWRTDNPHHHEYLNSAALRVTNVVIKLALAAMDYRGRYFDYAQWNAKDFPSQLACRKSRCSS